MSGPTEFTLDSVRQYMLMQDGRVTNHELVKHFRAFLTHPTQKEVARQKFKEYVNTLATIKQENGEKYLMLKKKFYPNFEEEPEQESSLLDEVMAGIGQQMTQQPQGRRILPQTPNAGHYGNPQQMYQRSQPPVPSDLGLPTANPTPPPPNSR